MPTRLKRGDISIKELHELSYSVYGKQVDNKAKREQLDVLSAQITYRNNLEEKDGDWKQTGRNIKIIFRCKTNPKSYKKTDSINPHVFPVTFLIRSIDEGINSAFRYRSGGNFKWRFPDKKVSDGRTEREKDKIRKKNKMIMESNIKKGLDGQFFFHLMQVLKLYGLLFGPNTTNGKLPKITNPKYIPYFEKHSLHCLEHYVIPMLKNPNKFFTNLR